MADDLLPLLSNEKDAKRLQALLRQRFVAYGGIAIDTSPDGSVVSIGFRRRIGGVSDSGREIQWSKVTAITPTTNAPPLKYTVRIGHWSAPTSTSAGTWVDDSAGKDAFAWLPQSQVPPLVGDYIRMDALGGDSSTPPVTYSNIISAPGDFNVYLTQNGGSNGDDGSTTTAAFPTYTYDVYLDSAQTIKIGSALSVLFHRPLMIAVTAGTYGLARLNGLTVILITTDEYFGRTSC
jgi:hypothetical protein